MPKIIGLKEFRENVGKYAKKVREGHSFVVVKRSKPIFQVAPVEEEGEWETVVDFSKIRKGGVPAESILKYLRNERAQKKSKKA